MDELDAVSEFGDAAKPDESFALEPGILAWFKARGAGWQNEINGVLSFYIETVRHPAAAASPMPVKPKQMLPP